MQIPQYQENTNNLGKINKPQVCIEEHYYFNLR